MHFDALIVVTPDDCKRLLKLYPRLVDNFEYGQLCFIGAPGVGEAALNDEAIGSRVKWLDENSLIPFDEVHACVAKKLEPLLKGQALPRGVTGWYYQQFLKMQYSMICEDEYYMVWDGDTVPCRKINMFSPETGQPYLDLKHEYHPEYFDTMGKILPGFRKVIERSFISEHMLFKTEIMKALIADIEKNDQIPGEKFWEKIINCIEPEKIYDSSFSEFETFGTYVALRYPAVYKLREWHSFRLGSSFFDMNTICERDFEWLSRDFDAISFEKGMVMLEENKNLFDNPEYQNKLSARKMLQLAQMEMTNGYKEIWEDDIDAVAHSNYVTGGYHDKGEKELKMLILVSPGKEPSITQSCVDSIRDTMQEGNYEIVVLDEGEPFTSQCNRAVASSVGTDFASGNVVLLDGNVILPYDALYFLRHSLYLFEDVGAVGSVSNNAPNKQKIQVSFNGKKEYLEFGEKNNVAMVMPSLERVRLAGFSLIIRRSVWNDIGGFDEACSDWKFAIDDLCIRIQKSGHRIEVARNSFVYIPENISWNEYESVSAECTTKYGFDISRYCYADVGVISGIKHDQNDMFNVLVYGCGLGADMKAIRSLFPNCVIIGVETDDKLFEVTKKTEKVYRNTAELSEYYEEQYFDILIIDEDVDQALSEEESIMLSVLLREDAEVLYRGAGQQGECS